MKSWILVQTTSLRTYETMEVSITENKKQGHGSRSKFSKTKNTHNFRTKTKNSVLRIKVLGRGIHCPGWVGLSDFFDPTQKFGLVGLVTQPNPKLFTTRPNPTRNFSQPNPTQPSIFGLGC